MKEGATQSKQPRDPLLGRGPPVEKRIFIHTAVVGTRNWFSVFNPIPWKTQQSFVGRKTEEYPQQSLVGFVEPQCVHCVQCATERSLLGQCFDTTVFNKEFYDLLRYFC